MNKVYKNLEEALFDINNGKTIMLGGFGLCGIPENCIALCAPYQNKMCKKKS